MLRARLWLPVAGPVWIASPLAHAGEWAGHVADGPFVPVSFHY